MLVKGKEFQVINEYKNGSLLVSYKEKKYYLRKFEVKSLDFYNALYSLKRVKSTGIKCAKAQIVDKKNGYVLTNYIEGQTILERLAQDDLSEEAYKAIFTSAFLCKLSKIALDFTPEHWIYNNDGLFYIGSTFVPYNEKCDFANCGVRLWFFTKDFYHYAKDKGFEVNSDRLIDEYVLNKKIVLTACNYYR